jgi:hypothetical protein
VFANLTPIGEASRGDYKGKLLAVRVALLTLALKSVRKRRE